ncbi:hypothetical protein LOTGIDRAFT_232384 [Lottia gigantea]|uniref:PH domain-containing protein n=1 Tax=Lottia gigantea TaxID=225164 RepID=V4AHB9_LOTGI|nr:hypothetical protein LOTGIDRAFT_232384 [Lottia gigantea]ESO94580.1 hypothetical protein LOTGIDRAFT_232384 [Lottia gigantea]
MAAAPHVRKSCMKFLEGFLEHRGQDNKWRIYWLVLKDQNLYIFKSKETVQDNLVGSLPVNRDTKFILGECDPKRESFRFELRTSRHQNNFKAKKYSERELWRGYIEGLASGAVPSDLDLMHGQIQMIEDEIRNYYCNKTAPVSHRRPSIGAESFATGFSDPDGSFGSFGSSESETMSTNNGGPFMKHKFWMESYRTDTPSWFFANCTRELAEKILLGSPQLGNTLMRESHTYKNNGSYTISKLLSVERSPLSHFEVIRVAAGYKINAENAPETFQCLSEVMKHFVRISGAAATRPFVTNDYKKLGIETPDYTTKIVKVDNDNGEQLPEQYEEPLPPSCRPMDGSKTLPNRANMSSFKSALPSATQVGPRDRAQRPGLGQVDHSAAMAGALSDLDTTIKHYDDEHPYNRRAYSEYKEVKYLPIPPDPPSAQQPHIPVDASTSAVLKTCRSQSVPAVQFNPLEQNVPITRPGMVKRNQSYREPDHNRQPQSPRSVIQPAGGFDPYRHGCVPANLSGQGNASPEDPYRASASLSSDPYRRDQENPYKGRSLPPPPTECHNAQVYQNFPLPKNTTSPTDSPLNSPRTPTSPRLSVGDSMLLGDIQSQLAKLKPTGKSTTGPQSPETKATIKDPQSPGVKSPPPVAPKSKPAVQTANTYRNLTSSFRKSNIRVETKQLITDEYYEDIDTYINNNYHSNSSWCDVYDDCYVPHNIVVNTRTIGNVSTVDNASSESRKDINDNNTNIIEESHPTGEDKENLKKKLEAMFSGSTPVAPIPMIPKTKSVLSLPLPPVPKVDQIEDEVYEEIKTTLD